MIVRFVCVQGENYLYAYTGMSTQFKFNGSVNSIPAHTHCYSRTHSPAKIEVSPDALPPPPHACLLGNLDPWEGSSICDDAVRMSYKITYLFIQISNASTSVHIRIMI